MSTSQVRMQEDARKRSLSSKLTSIESRSTSDDDDEWWDEEENTQPVPHEATDIAVSVWPKPPQHTGLGVSFKPENLTFGRKTDRRYSVQKPTRDKSKGRQRKQNAKAGIKVFTNFSRHQPVAPPVQLQHSREALQTGCFVDLAALQALDGGNVQPLGGLWKTRKNKELVSTTSTMSSLSGNAQAIVRGYRVQDGGPHDLLPRPSHNIYPSLSIPSDDLSPNDRPIVIGISIPTTDVTGRTPSLQTAVPKTTNIVRSYQHSTPMTETPDTPTIIITPARDGSIWSPLEEGGITTYQRSSISVYVKSKVPPVPQMPVSYLEKGRQRVAAQRSYFSPDSDDATAWGDEDGPSKSRVTSSCTIFEEDESPILVRPGRAVSITSGFRVDRHASISTQATNRHSKGWWNYITTPFLTRSNTFATRDARNESPPSLPCLTLAATKAQEAERDDRLWEKQFSPLTPETTTSIASDRCWNADLKNLKTNEHSPVLKDSRHKAQASTGTLPLVLSETAGFGSITMPSIAIQVPKQLSRGNTSSTLQTGHNCLSNKAAVHNLSDDSVSRPLESNNPFIQPRLSGLNRTGGSTNAIQASISRSVEGAISHNDPKPTQYPSAGPPPPYSPPPARLRYMAVFPPGHTAGTQYPSSPGPLSPGLQQAMSAGGAIPMSTVPSTPSARRPINLNSGYSEPPLRQSGMHVVGEHYGVPLFKPTKAEAKRKRHEKEETIADRAGGWWRGRGCMPERGCYGRQGPEGRKRRRWYLGLTFVLVSIIIMVVALATTLHRKPNTMIESSRWLNLTGFPPIFLGISNIAAPINIRTNTGCVFPATKWSCDLPKELQPLAAPNLSNQPSLFLHIQWDNSSSTNATFANVTGSPSIVVRHTAFSPVSAGQLVKRLLLSVRQIVTFVPSPAPPSIAESIFLGNGTDGIVSDKKAGEPTPFYISFLSSANSEVNKRQLLERKESGEGFPNITSIIPPPSLKSDGTAATANLLPFPTQQPVRLYDRGLPTEHYGFYTYFDRSIFLKSIDRLNSSNLGDGEVPTDRNGGAHETEAAFRCTWSQTRFLVQMWTRMNTSTQLLNSTQYIAPQHAAVDLNQPGSFPYPTTITTDRHGGDPTLKMVYCYEMNSRQGLVAGSGKVNAENRAFGGTAYNPAPSLFSNTSDPSLGGFDGGTGGCSCQWTNFRSITRA